MLFFNTTALNEYAMKNSTKKLRNLKNLLILFCFGISIFCQGSTKPILRLQLYNTSNPSISDETVIYFDTNATSGFDSNYDAYKLMNTGADIPNVYSIVNVSKLSINGLPLSFNNDITVNIGLQVPSTGIYQFNASQIINFPSYIEITLIDTEKNISQNLNENPKYSFSYKPGLNDGRFLIRISPMLKITGIDKKTEKNKFTISTNGNSISVSSLIKTSGSPLILNIFNISGQLIANSQISANSDYRFILQNGAYILRLMVDNKAYTKKIVIE